MPNLIGSDPSQISTNGMLGTAAFIDAPQLPVSTATQAALDAKVGTSGPQTITANSTSPALTITQDGTGNALEVRDVTGDSTPFVVDASGKVLVGSPSTAASTPIMSVAGDMAFNSLSTVPGRAATYTFGVADNSVVGGYKTAIKFVGAGANGFQTDITFSNLASDLYNATLTERMRITSAGLVTANNSTGLGYGAGSGGTVTQATSKSTAVTLNKPSGQITMHNAALAAGATVAFVMNNSTISGYDTLSINTIGGGDTANYSWNVQTAGGFAAIYVTNRSGGSLSDALVFQFNVIKGTTS